MILYFSATGNCKYVAGRIARAIGQDAVSIVDCIREGRYSFSDESIGMIAPTYFWGLPSIVKEFLEKASFRTDYLYYIATYGTTPGASDYMAKRAIRGCEISAFYSIRMADTWTPVFDLSTPEKVARFTKTTEAEIDRAINYIAARRTNRHMRPRVPAIMVQWIAQPLYAQKDTNYHYHRRRAGVSDRRTVQRTENCIVYPAFAQGGARDPNRVSIGSAFLQLR